MDEEYHSCRNARIVLLLERFRSSGGTSIAPTGSHRRHFAFLEQEGQAEGRSKAKMWVPSQARRLHNEGSVNVEV